MQIGVEYTARARWVRDCRRAKADWYGQLIPALDPDIVILAHRPIFDPLDTVARMSAQGRPIPSLLAADQPVPAALRDATTATLERLRRGGREVVIIEPVPAAPFDPVDCLATRPAASCRFVASRPTPLERFYRTLDTPTVDIDRLVCPYLPICDPIIDGIAVRRDESHLTVSYAQTLADQLAELV